MRNLVTIEDHRLLSARVNKFSLEATAGTHGCDQYVQGELQSGRTSLFVTYSHDERPAVHEDDQQNEPKMPKLVTAIEIRVGSVCVCARTGQDYGHWILFIDDFI